MRRFYVGNAVTGLVATLSDAESKHVRQVLRLEEGTPVLVFDGKGSQYEATLQYAPDGQTQCAIGEKVEQNVELPVHVTVYQALIKGDHFDYAVQKSVEGGATRIVPFVTERCVKIPKSPDRFLERENRIAREAAKQCGRSFIPEVTAPLSFEEAAEKARRGLSILAYEKEHSDSLRTLLQSIGCPQRARIYVGPEGGFTDEEANLLREKGAHWVTLGPRILRAETAALYMLSQFAYECEK